MRLAVIFRRSLKIMAANKIKAGKKVEKMLEKIDEELAVFGLTGPDLLTIDRKTAKIVTNAGADIKKLRKDYKEFIEDPDYKYYFRHKNA